MCTFTIFTPCYNGAKTIHRVFESVESQTFEDFEWIIINDGSTDFSDNVIKKLISNSSVKDKIIYLSQTNQGKHVIWNQAVQMAKGKWFVSADCDDSFKPETLFFFANKINNIRGGASQRHKRMLL